MRVLERLSCARIAARLNLDPDRCPPPTPNRAETTNGRWTASAVRSILENPKYTGYQVWNRRARKRAGNKANPISEWVWSPHPTHEPLVTRALFGPDRSELLAADLAAPPTGDHTPAEEQQKLHDQAAQLQRRKERLLDQLDSDDEDEDTDPQTAAEFRRGIRRRYDDLEKQRRAILAKITETETETQTGSGELLELIPRLRVRLPDLPPEAQRQIYDAFQLQLHYRGADRRLQLQVTISAALAENIDRITGQIAERIETDTQGSDQPFRACPRQDSNLRPSA